MITAPAKDDDDAQNPRPVTQGKTIQPLNPEEVKKSLRSASDLTSTSDDMLAELAAKTTALAEQITGKEAPENRTLILETNIEKQHNAIDTELSKDERSADEKSHKSNPAADLIRSKLQSLYKKEPDPGVEAAEAVAVKQKSKHQLFMYELTTSGKSLAEIQTEWHNYYVQLPDAEKHEVWQEFYANQAAVSAYARHLYPQTTSDANQKKENDTKPREPFVARKPVDDRDPKQIKNQLLDTINAGGKLKPIHHIKSLLFGVGLAGFAGLLMGFVFFNEVFIAPFISPSRSVSATPIIGQIDEAVGPEPKIIIPKINLEVPVVYGTGTIEEQAIQDALENGVVHYPASPEPGQQGNVVIVGHSSNNILNSGKYKFAFVLLRRLENEDTFFIHKDGVRYTYKVFEKKVVAPNDVSVLGPSSRANTITLITCDPPGTSLNRLVVVAEQISPDPASNVAVEPPVTPSSEPAELPSNAPSLWSRLWPF